MLQIAFLHPDLGIGGAERLVISAARELQARGHQVTLFTTRLNPAHCFEETRDGTLDVRVRGDFLPSHLGGRLRAPCMITRMTYLAATVAVQRRRFDVIVCDLVAHVIPLLRLFSRTPIVFYCHYPDRLLVARDRAWYRAYRIPIDWLEQRATGLAHRVLVNSHFTGAAFHRAFPQLASAACTVVHPGIDVAAYPYPRSAPDEHGLDQAITLLAIARYVPSKALHVAIETLALLRGQLGEPLFARLRLVVAGAYDPHSSEHQQTLAGLQALARQRALVNHVEFVPSPSDAQRLALLGACRAVLHTAPQEHFGYTPLEAMAAGRPVVAANCGGPLETIRNGETGFLCPPTPAAFAVALAPLIADPALAMRMGDAAREHVRRHFSHATFGNRLEAVLQAVVARPTAPA